MLNDSLSLPELFAQLEDELPLAQDEGDDGGDGVVPVGSFAMDSSSSSGLQTYTPTHRTYATGNVPQLGDATTGDYQPCTGFSALPIPMPPRAALQASAASATSQLSAVQTTNRVLCPYCSGKSITLGGAKRGEKYAYMCEKCGQRWNQLRQPNEMGDFEITPSNRKVGDEQRRSGGYACGKCGAKPKFGHICPFKNIDVADAATIAQSNSSSFKMAPLVASPASVLAQAQACISTVQSVHGVSGVVAGSIGSGSGSGDNSTVVAPPPPSAVQQAAALVAEPIPAPVVGDDDEALFQDDDDDDDAWPVGKTRVRDDGRIEICKRRQIVRDGVPCKGMEHYWEIAAVGKECVEARPDGVQISTPSRVAPVGDETVVEPDGGKVQCGGGLIDEDEDEMATHSLGGVVEKSDTSMIKSMNNNAVDGNAVIRLLKLRRFKVKGDGSCWVYALLASAQMCEHIHARVEQTPSPMDRARDLFCRILASTWLQQNGVAVLNLDVAEMSTIDAIMKVPEYPLADDDDYGTFGTNVSIAGLVAWIKVTVVLWNQTTLGNAAARQQVIEFVRDNLNVESLYERFWTNDEILAYSMKNQVVHIEWDGVNHYNALIGAAPVAFDGAFLQMLSALQPVTRLNPAKPMSRKHPRDEKVSDDGWLVLNDAIRGDVPPDMVQLTEWPIDTPISILKESCLQSGANAIVVIPAMQQVKFVTLPYRVLASDCATTGDFSCKFFIHNGNKRGKAPLYNCTCNTFYSNHTKAKRLLMCERCERWCHQGCTHLAGKSLAQLKGEDENFVCSACECE